METIIRTIKQFVEERDWDQFHSPANLSKSICIEAGELLEKFQWTENDYDIKEVKEELADVLIYCFQLAMKLDLDVKEIVLEKIKINETKYPVSKAKGNATKYTGFNEQ